MPGCTSQKPAENKIRQKTDMIPEVNIIRGKASTASINGAGGSGGDCVPQQGF